MVSDVLFTKESKSKMYIFDKKRRLQECVEYLIHVEERFDKKQFSSESWLQEMITITDITPRQTGTTTAISKLFNPKTDLYITHNRGCVEHFSQLLYLEGMIYNGKADFSYLYLPLSKVNNQLKNAMELINKELGIKISLDPKTIDLEKIYGRNITGIVWFDLGSYGMYQCRDDIYNMIAKLHRIFPKAKFMIC